MSSSLLNHDTREIDEYVNVFRDTLQYGWGFLVLRNIHRTNLEYNQNDTFFTDTNKHIDLWWLADDGGLSLLLPHIMSEHPYWQKLTKGGPDYCYIRLFLVTDNNINDKIGEETCEHIDPNLLNNKNVIKDWKYDVYKLM
eukprot:UN24499